MLVLTSAAIAQQTYTHAQARDILSSTEKFAQTYLQEAQNRTDPEACCCCFMPVNHAQQLLDLVKDDQQFLRQVYALYVGLETGYNGPFDDSAPSIISRGFMASNAIVHMNADDAWFKQVFEATKSGHSYDIRARALLKINDLTYIKKVIAEDAKVDDEFAKPSDSFLFARGEELYLTDPEFVDALAESAADTFVRMDAISATSNRTILQKYASLTDIDQSKHPPGSEAALRALENSHYQHIATWKLALLDKKK